MKFNPLLMVNTLSLFSTVNSLYKTLKLQKKTSRLFKEISFVNKIKFFFTIKTTDYRCDIVIKLILN